MASVVTAKDHAEEILVRRAPSGVICPKCGQQFAVFHQESNGKSFVFGGAFNRYCCRRCEHTFREPGLSLISTLILTMATLVLLGTHLIW